MKKNGRHIEWSNLGARLENYKELHKDRAKEKGCLERFMSAKTLTQARKVLKGGSGE